MHRMMFGLEPPPYHAGVSGGATPLIDRWHTVFYTPPGSVIIHSGSKPAGSNDPGAERSRRLFNLLTPETAASTHYFWGLARQFDREDARMSAFIQEHSNVTFAQDKAVLEAQQRELDRGGRSGIPAAHQGRRRSAAGASPARRLHRERRPARANVAAASEGVTNGALKP